MHINNSNSVWTHLYNELPCHQGGLMDVILALEVWTWCLESNTDKCCIGLIDWLICGSDVLAKRLEHFWKNQIVYSWSLSQDFYIFLCPVLIPKKRDLLYCIFAAYIYELSNASNSLKLLFVKVYNILCQNDYLKSAMFFRRWPLCVVCVCVWCVHECVCACVCTSVCFIVIRPLFVS